MHKEIYKKTYKKGTDTEETRSSVFLISMNDKMKILLDNYRIDYKNLASPKLPLQLYKYIKKGVEFRPDLGGYTYKSNTHFSPFYEDPSWDESSDNEIWFDNCPDRPKSIRTCLNYIFALAKLLEKFPEKFNIVLSIQDVDDETKIDGTHISFYCVRPSQPMMLEELDSYQYEAILVLTTKAIQEKMN